jgi:hypothetical protein
MIDFDELTDQQATDDETQVQYLASLHQAY